MTTRVNRFMTAVPVEERSTVRKSNNWERDGLIWRTLAPYSEVLGRTPCRSSSPRRHLQRVLRAVHPRHTHGHGAAA
jgi:hypothetical protein